MRETILLLAVATVLPAPLFGHAATGLQPFGSFSSGPFDIVNNGDLNVHFEIPIVSKAGRGLPFSSFSPSTLWSGSQWYPGAPRRGPRYLARHGASRRRRLWGKLAMSRPISCHGRGLFAWRPVRESCPGSPDALPGLCAQCRWPAWLRTEPPATRPRSHRTQSRPECQSTGKVRWEHIAACD